MSTLLEQASLVLIPSGYKEDVVYSQIPTNGNGDLSFTRASNGTRINSAGLVEVCPWNLLEYSEDFSNGVWVKTNTTVTTNTTTAPNGTTTADSLLETTATGDHRLWERPALISGQDYTFTIYVKQNGRKRFQIKIFDSSSVQASALFDVSTGTIVATNGTSSIENVGNGWYRCSIVATSPTSSTGYTVLDLATDSYSQSTASDSYTGDASKGVYIWGAQLNIGSTAKPYFPTTDRLNVPRLTYQNGGGGCPSLLLEKQSTNLWYYSEQFDNSEWLKTECTITANSVISPDGTQNADKITDTTANNEHRFRATNALFTISTATTFSIFAKAGEYSKFGIADLSNGYIVKFDLSAGTIISTGTDWSNAKIENFGNGWYRLSATRSTNATCGYAMLNDSGDFVFTGTGTKGVYIWGAQVEVSSYVTSYIPSTSSSATRVADACFKTGISSLIGQTEGVIFADITPQIFNDSAYQTVAIIYPSAGLGSTYFHFYKNLGTKNLFFEVWNASSQCSLSYTMANNTRYKVAAGYKNNDFVLYVNGVQVGSDTSGTVASVTYSTLEIGYDSFNTNPQMSLSEFVLFPTRLTNAELASLTTI